MRMGHYIGAIETANTEIQDVRYADAKARQLSYLRIAKITAIPKRRT